MELKLLKGAENENNIFSLSIKNIEGIERKTPSRAFKKVNSSDNTSYFTEAMLQIKNDELTGKPNYPKFDRNIEDRIKKKEVGNNVNIISFYGDKSTGISNLVKFEDLGLLSNFEALFNDHMIAMPYSLSLYNLKVDDIFLNVKNAFDSFFSVLSSKNLFGYIPSYVNYRYIADFLKFYSDRFKLTIRDSGSLYNAIPVMIDFKRSLPDKFKRSVAFLLKLKMEYIKEGFYPIYYAANVGMPRISIKKQRSLAKEFMLSFLGFDIIGASQAVPATNGFGHSVPSSSIDFDQQSFNYVSNDMPDKYNRDIKKSEIFKIQTSYLNRIHDKALSNEHYPGQELAKRKTANDYINTFKGS